MNALAPLTPFMQALGLTVAHSIWQIALIWLIFKVLEARFVRAHLGVYRLALCALLVSAVWAVVTFSMEWARWSPPVDAWTPVFEAASPTITPTSLAENQPTDRPFWSHGQAWMEANATLIGGAWLICAVFLWIRLLGGWYLARRLRTHGVTRAEDSFQNNLQHWANTLKIKSKIMLLESPHISEPLTLGFWKPVVLFPVGMLLQLSTQQVEALLLHELAHIRRHDYLVNLLQLSLEVCFFYHPLFWQISKEARARREFCCDSVVMRHTSNPLLYAQTLTDLQLSFLKPSTQFVMNATGKSRFTERILHIVGISPKRTNHSSGWLLVLLPLMMALFAGWPALAELPTLSTSEFTAQVEPQDTIAPRPKPSHDPTIARPKEVAPAVGVSAPQEVDPSAEPSGLPVRRAAVEALKMNVLFIGVDNPIRVAVEGVSSSELEITLVGEGSVSGQNGEYQVRVTTPGEVKIRVMHKQSGGGRLITEQKYRVKRIPDPQPYLDGTYRSGTYVAEQMKLMKSLDVRLPNFDFDAECAVVGFEVTYLPKNSDPVSRMNHQNLFNADILAWMKQTSPGDRYYMDDIMVMCPGDTEPRNIGGMVFKVQE